ncbi:NAD(P)-binding protein [Dentipellis sp. KUC8613]|nr:NAD(P)-binding protein [Dentipellis sp. KUC8613]
MSSAADLFSTAGRVAVITGGGTGLGFRMAQAWVKNGGKVYITGRREAKLKEAVKVLNDIAGSPGRALYFCGSVTEKADIDALVAYVGEREQQVDVLVNNAGTYHLDKYPTASRGSPMAQTLAEYDKDLWAYQYIINVWSVGAVTAAFVPLLAEATKNGGERDGRGAVIIISSISGDMWASPDRVNGYRSSKAGTNALGKMLAARLLQHGIRVNTISPGSFPSGLNDVTNPELPAHPDNVKRNVPMKRNGDESDILGVFLWLATRAGAYVSGQKILVDGGMNLVMNGRPTAAL